MNGDLIIRMTVNDGASWLPVDTQGRALGAVQQGPLAHAAGMAAARRVTVLVPGSQLLVTRIRIPGVKGARLRQAVPFALEDQVVGELADLHFACGQPDDDGNLLVAVVDRRVMDAWSSQLSAAGINPQRMLPDFCAVPSSGETVIVVDDHQDVLVRTADGAGFAGSADLVPAVAADAGATVVVPQGVAVPSSIAGWADQRGLSGGLLPWLATAAVTAEPDLLQGSYAVKRGLRMPSARWRVPAGLAAVLALVWMTGWLLEYRALWKEHDQLQQDIATRFSELVPGEPMTDEPEVQIRRRLGMAGAAGGDLLPLLDAVSAALAAETGVELTALSYRPGVMEFGISANRAEQLEQIRARIEAQGMPSTIAGATSRGDRVDGRIAVRSGS